MRALVILLTTLSLAAGQEQFVMPAQISWNGKTLTARIRNTTRYHLTCSGPVIGYTRKGNAEELFFEGTIISGNSAVIRLHTESDDPFISGEACITCYAPGIMN